MASNYYQLLGIPENASLAVVKSAFKRLAKQYHPDVNRHDHYAEEKFKQINEAYRVLSDGYQRQIYDAQLSGQRQPIYQQHPNYNQHPHKTTRRRRPRPYYKAPRPQFSAKEERLSNLYAFGFVGIMSVIGIIINILYNIAEEKKINDAQAGLLTGFAKSEELFFEGKIQLAVEELKLVKREYEKMPKIKTFEYELVKASWDKSQSHYQEKNYDSALYHLLVSHTYNKMQSFDFYSQLATCYKEIGFTDQAIIILDDLLVRDNYNVKIINEIAHIYLEIEQDTALSLKYFELGAEVIFKKFQDVYGEGYRLFVTKERTPDYYFDTFYGLGNLHFQNADYIATIKMLEWACFLKPNHLPSHLALAQAYLYADQKHLACKYYQKALQIDQRVLEYTDLAKNCK
jgi:curved DNA-binding protein CbpA